MFRFSMRDLLWFISVVALVLSLATSVWLRQQDRSRIDALTDEANYWKGAAHYFQHEIEKHGRSIEFAHPLGVEIDGQLKLLSRPE